MQSGFATSATMGKASHRSSLNRSLDLNRKPKRSHQRTKTNIHENEKQMQLEEPGVTPVKF